MGQHPTTTVKQTIDFSLDYHRQFTTREQAQREITEYVEMFYNQQRKQALYDQHQDG